MSRAPVALAAGLATLAVAGWAAQASLPTAAASSAVALRGGAAARTSTRVGTVLVCPSVGYIPGTERTMVGIASSATGGRVQVEAASGAASGAAGAPRTVLQGGATSAVLTPPPGPLEIVATGPVAGGLVAEQISRANSSDLRGWSDVPCTAPQAVQWFVGPGTAVGETPTLTLSNPDSSPALVNVSVLTPTGPASSLAGRGIALPPHTVKQLALAELAPNAAVTAVRVATVSGRVASSLRDVRVSGRTDMGTDYAPPTAGPAHVVALPGIPGRVLGRVPQRVLDLANPFARATTVQVSVTRSSGTFVPTGLAAVPVPADSVRQVGLVGALGSAAGPSMVTVTASGGAGQVLAGVLVNAASSTTPIHEIAYLGATPALQGPGIVPVNPTGRSTASFLVLAAPKGAGRARVSVHLAHGTASKVVTVAGGQAVTLDLATLGGTAGALTLTPDPGSGPLYAARLVVEQGARGPLLSAFPVVGAPPRVPVAAVAPAVLSSS